jgi:hypothetical protein
MLGIIPKYKSDISRALFQISPANIVGQYLAFTIDLNNVGTILNDYYAFSIGDTENALFQDKKFQLDQFNIGKTALRFVRGESPKMIVGYKEVQIAGFPKYKFITLDVEKVRNYFDANYGKISIADIVTHLNSIKNTLVQTSFFTTDMLPKSVVVKELTMPVQAKKVVAKSEGIPEYISNETYSWGSPFASKSNLEKTLLVDSDFFFFLSHLRGFHDDSGELEISWGYADQNMNHDMLPVISFNSKDFFKDKVWDNLKSVNDFYNRVVYRYERMRSKRRFEPLPQSIGNGMTSFNGENLYTGNFLKSSDKPIIGLFRGYDSAKKQITYFLVSWKTELPRIGYSVTKSQMKAFISIEKFKSKSQIVLKYPEIDSFYKATGIKEVIDLQKSNTTKKLGSTKDEQFANALSLIDSSKVQSLSNKNPKFKEVFDLAIGEIYKTYIASPTNIEPTNKKNFYFKLLQDSNSKGYIYISTTYNIDLDTTNFKVYCSSSEIPRLQQLVDVHKSEALKRIMNKESRKSIYLNLAIKELFFDSEPMVKFQDDFFTYDYQYEDVPIYKFGFLNFYLQEKNTEAQTERIFSFMFDNLVNFSLKVVVTTRVLMTCAMGKKEDMLEYFQKQVKFLIDHDLILSKEKLLEVQSFWNEVKFKKVNFYSNLAYFYQEGAILNSWDSSNTTNFFVQLIDKCCENNPDLNEYFNPPMVISAEPVVEPIIEEPQIITTEPQVVEDDDFADIFAENNEVNQKLQELQQLRQEVAGQDNLIDNLDL